MSERMSAEIFIGGPVSQELVSGLCEAIDQEGAALEWGEATFRPHSAADLMEARQDELGVLLLRLCNTEASGGWFERLENFLQEQGIGFSRRSEGKWEYDPERVEYRPVQGYFRCMASQDGEPTICTSGLSDVENSLAEAVELLDRGHDGATEKAQACVRTALAKLREELRPQVPPLAPFEIVQTPAISK
jgi:hypothetical protein